MCGIGLKDWSADDEPLFEHVRHSPDCLFLYTYLGQDVLDAYKVGCVLLFIVFTLNKQKYVRHSLDCMFLYIFLGQDVLDSYKVGHVPLYITVITLNKSPC